MAEGRAPLKRILFVCVENANRSQMAQAFARMHGGDRVEAASAGSRPSGQLNPKAIQVMAERDYDLTRHRSTAIDALGDAPLDAVVTMGCGDTCPHLSAALREDWEIPDPRELPLPEVRAIRDEIERRVRALLERL
jgi:protein-tyrosine-phosphatase